MFMSFCLHCHFLYCANVNVLITSIKFWKGPKSLGLFNKPAESPTYRVHQKMSAFNFGGISALFIVMFMSFCLHCHFLYCANVNVLITSIKFWKGPKSLGLFNKPAESPTYRVHQKMSAFNFGGISAFSAEYVHYCSGSAV